MTPQEAAIMLREWYIAFDRYGKGNERTVKEFLEAADMLEDLAKRVPRWNIVKEKPPREGECVFCYYPDKEYGSKIMVDFNQYGTGETPFFSNQALWGRCTHWMPMHEPPEEG